MWNMECGIWARRRGRALAAAPSIAAVLLAASLSAFTGYGIVATGMSYLGPSLFGSACASFLSIVLFSWLFRRAPNHVITARVEYTWKMILFRVAVSTALVLLVTGFASSVGARWAGLFSAFPLVVFPLVLLIHMNYGKDQARTVLKNFPRGLWTVLVYSLIISWTYGPFGIYGGTAMAYAGATSALLVINWRILLSGRNSG